MPRPYNLAKRAEQSRATRGRILAAALEIYRERGYAAATTQAVARAADVAPGTVRNHFPTPLDLAAAAAETILLDTGMPGLDVFDGLATVTERVEALARELAGFFERSGSWWEVRQGDPDLAAAWVDLERRYDERVARLAAAAVESGVGDVAVAVAVAVVVPAVGGPMYFRLRGAGLSVDETIALELSVIGPWLETLSD